MSKIEEQMAAVVSTVDEQGKKLEQLGGVLAQLQPLVARLSAVASPPAGAFQPAPQAMQMVNLTPQQAAAVQADPRLLQQYLPPNGAAASPTPEQPNRLFVHSGAGFKASLVEAKARIYGAHLPPEVALAIATVEAEQSLERFSRAGTVVMPDVPKGFKWEWYHVVGVGLLCALVGVGGVWAYGKWFKDKTAG